MPAQSNLKPALTAAEVNALMASVYPQLNDQFSLYEALEVFPGGCTVRLNADERHLRPGGVVDRLDRGMPVVAVQQAEDRLALGGHPQALLPEQFGELIDRLHDNGSLSTTVVSC